MLQFLGSVHVVRKELVLTRVSAEPGKWICWVKVDSVNRISVLNLTQVLKHGLPGSDATYVSAG